MTSASTVSRVLITAWGFIFLALVLYKTNSQGNDPYRCRALLETGRWIDPPDENGDRMPFHQWQPNGCLLHQYTPDDIVQCMQKRDVLFVGDSTVRQMAEGLVRLLHISSDMYKEFDISEHAGWKIPHRGLSVNFVWNPFLQASGEWNPYSSSGGSGSNDTKPDLTEFVEGSERLIEDMHMPVPVPVDDQEGPALLLLGAGPWFSQSLKRVESNLWMERYRATVENASELLRGNLKDPFSEPLDTEDGVGSRALFVPPSHGFLAGDGLDQGRDPYVETEQILMYQAWLKDSEDKLNFQMAWALSQVVEGQNKTIGDPTKSGWHYIDDVSNMRTNIMLNYRCNAKLDRDKKDPSRGTCCTDYGYKSKGQTALIGTGIFLLVTCLVLETLEILTRREAPFSRLFNMQALGAFVLPLLMLHYADRTQMMAKGAMVFDAGSLAFLCVVWFSVGLLAMRRVSVPSTKSEPIVVEPDRAQIFQSQMNEWKGWILMMMISISWVNHESVRGNIATMVLMSALLFQFCYEHTMHFLTTKDYSLDRVVNVLLRLNMLTFLVCYFADIKYYNYGYILQASFFFIVVWATLALKHKQLNDDSRFIIAKIILSVVIVSVFVKSTPVVNWAAAFLNTFNVEWNNIGRLRECLTIDIYIPYIAMVLAVANHTYPKALRPTWSYPLGVMGLVVLWLFWAACTDEGMKFSTYKNMHSLISFVPIMAFVALRNASASVRNYQSRTMAWVGQCSIELYVLHFHLFLAANAHGVLLTGAFAGDGTFLRDRWRDLIIIAPIFIGVSSCAATGTSNLVNVILPASSQSESQGYSEVSAEEKNCPDDVDFEKTPKRPIHARVARRLIKLCLQFIGLITQMPSPMAMINSSGGRAMFVLLALWGLNVFVQ